MTATLAPDALWNLVELKGERPRIPNRAYLTGILFVLRSGIPWQMFPRELDCGSGLTCWRRLRDLQDAGTWDLVHFALLDWLARHDQIELVASRCRQLLCARGRWWGKDWSESHGSSQAWQHASPDLPRPWSATRGPFEWCEPA
jgi:transposase